MKHNLENQTLTIFLEGELNSSTAEAIGKELN